MEGTWIQEKKDQARQRQESKDENKLKYGLTIRLDSKRIQLRHETDSEQVITMQHENCEVLNIFDNLDNPDIKNNLLSTTPNEDTKIEAFIEEKADMGLAIIAPENSNATVDLTRTLSSETFVEHILVVAKPGSTVTVIDKYTNTNTNMRAATVEVIAQQDAHIKYASINALNHNCVDLASHRSRAEQNGKVDWFVASLGGNLSRCVTENELHEGSNVRSYGVYLGVEDQQFDIRAATFHKGNKSSSDMYTRGVLDDKAKAVYRGLLDIDSQAFGCDGYQTEETIVIGDDAVADAIPDLQIRNNDVRCSHGASIGRIDEEKLFYLLARGIKRQEAVKMVVEGFFEPVTHKLEWPELFELIQPLVHDIIS